MLPGASENEVRVKSREVGKTIFFMKIKSSKSIGKSRFIAFMVMLVFLCGFLPARAADETCVACDLNIVATGDFQHGPYNGEVIIPGLPASKTVAYRGDICGKNFSIIIPNLPAGKFIVVLGFSETQFTNSGARVFDVTCGGKVLLNNFDIFANVGWAKVCLVTNVIEHQDDSLAGPLTLTFTGKTQLAKLNTMEIRDTPKHASVTLMAADLVPSDPELMKVPQTHGPDLWKDPALPIATRVSDLLARLTPAEKIGLMRNDTPRIERLGIPAYNQWNECLHGVANAGVATVFPQAIGLAAAWDVSLMHNIGDSISVEARAKHNDYAAKHNGDSARFYGLTFWTPNINIFRDSRWGRGQETYGEDPFLTGQLAVQFIRGLQGDDPDHLKAMACAKHFAVHSGPEAERHFFDVSPPERDLYETYLPQFEAAVREGKVGAVMGAYNSLFGEPCCSSKFLLADTLRKNWGFTGHVVSDCGAIRDIYANHKVVATAAEAAARAVKAGCDLCCGIDYNALASAFKSGLITDADLNTAAARLLDARFRLGLYDTPEANPLLKIPASAGHTPTDAALALRAACESIVLLKNDGLLPLDRKKINRIAVIGRNADSVPMLLGNYSGTPVHPLTILKGIHQLVDGVLGRDGAPIQVVAVTNFPLALPTGAKPVTNFSAAVAAAKSADVVIYVGGLDATLEREENKGLNMQGFFGGDRTAIELPQPQEALLRALFAVGKPVVFVNCSGSAIAMPWAEKNLPAIVQAWYPGQAGGRAVAEVLFGEQNPSGKLPVTFYASTKDLPPFDDYAMSNRTYRYFTGKPLFAFGHGLSYTTFKFADARLVESKIATGGKIQLSFTVKNSGKRNGEEVAQVYFRHVHSAVAQPLKSLCGFQRVSVDAGKAAEVNMEIAASQLRYWVATKKSYVVEPGEYELLIGGASDEADLVVPLEVR